MIAFDRRQWAAFLDEMASGAASQNGELRTLAGDTYLRALATGVTLRFTPAEWSAFVAGVRDREFSPVA